jgi:hypothetical protein
MFRYGNAMVMIWVMTTDERRWGLGALCIPGFHTIDGKAGIV